MFLWLIYYFRIPSTTINSTSINDETIFLDNRFQHDHAIDANESSRISQEQTKRGPPTNRNISLRNIKAQIANMFANESAGFKSEYQVRASKL